MNPLEEIVVLAAAGSGFVGLLLGGALCWAYLARRHAKQMREARALFSEPVREIPRFAMPVGWEGSKQPSPLEAAALLPTSLYFCRRHNAVSAGIRCALCKVEGGRP